MYAELVDHTRKATTIKLLNLIEKAVFFSHTCWFWNPLPHTKLQRMVLLQTHADLENVFNSDPIACVLDGNVGENEPGYKQSAYAHTIVVLSNTTTTC